MRSVTQTKHPTKKQVAKAKPRAGQSRGHLGADQGISNRRAVPGSVAHPALFRIVDQKGPKLGMDQEDFPEEVRSVKAAVEPDPIRRARFHALVCSVFASPGSTGRVAWNQMRHAFRLFRTRGDNEDLSRLPDQGKIVDVVGV